MKVYIQMIFPLKHLPTRGHSSQFFLYIGIYLLLPCICILHSKVFASVVINEVFPKTQDPAYEWVELYNDSTDSISLDRWKLQNSSSNTSFGMNASAIIQPHGFLLFLQTQTGISLSSQGDTLRLINEKGEQVDSLTYPGILGYNMSYGRSVGGQSSVCTVATPEKANDCPPPPTVVPTVIPSPTRVPTVTPTEAPLLTTVLTTAIPTQVIISPPQSIVPTPMIEESSKQQPLGIIVIVGIVIVWIVLIAMIRIYKNKKTL